MADREQVRRDAEEVRGVLRSDVETPEQRDEAEAAFDRILAELHEIERGWSDDDKRWRERLEQAERERDENEEHGNDWGEESLDWMRRAKDAEARLASVPALVEALRMGKRIAERGVGPDTSPEQVLVTLVAFFDAKLKKFAVSEQSQGNG